MPKKATKKLSSEEESISFEEALAELEDITRKLESGQLSLDDSISTYERGMVLRKLCQKKLNEAEKKLEYLKRKEDGTLERAPIQIEPSDLENTGQSRLFQT